MRAYACKQVCGISHAGKIGSYIPMIGGMISSTVLTLVVIPANYGLIKGWNLPIISRVIAIAHNAAQVVLKSTAE